MITCKFNRSTYTMEPSSLISDLLNLANTIVIVDGDVKESLSRDVTCTEALTNLSLENIVKPRS